MKRTVTILIILLLFGLFTLKAQEGYDEYLEEIIELEEMKPWDGQGDLEGIEELLTRLSRTSFSDLEADVVMIDFLVRQSQEEALHSEGLESFLETMKKQESERVSTAKKMKLKRNVRRIVLGATLLSLGAVSYFQAKATNAEDRKDDAINDEEKNELEDEVAQWEQIALTSLGGSLLGVVTFLVLFVTGI